VHTNYNKISRSDINQEKTKKYVMKNKFLSILLLTMSIISFSSFAQSENDEELLGLPGDDLDLYAVLDLFQKSKTVEAFEKSLNDTKAGIVNLDLNNDGKVDFIKVETKKDGDDFLFILQDPISEKETQDVAVMTVSKDAEGKVSMQVIGDEKLYGKDYVIEPRTEAAAAVTSNPAYVGDDPVTVSVPATTEIVVVQSAPVVQYVYSPAYVPYAPPYYYGYYPHYWAPIAVISIGIYRHNHYYHHNNYYGGRGNTNVNINVNSRNSYNNYNNNSRNSSRTVNNNIKNGNFKTSGQRGSRPSNGSASNRASSKNRASTNNRASTSNRAAKSKSSSKSKRPTTKSTSKRPTTKSTAKRKTGKSTSKRPTTKRPTTKSTAKRPTTNRSTGSRSMGSHSSGASRSTASRGGGSRRRH
jgi:hypothetical protein